MAQRTDPDNPVIPRSIQSGAQLRKWYEDHRDSRALILKAETIRPSGAPKVMISVEVRKRILDRLGIIDFRHILVFDCRCAKFSTKNAFLRA